MTTEETWPRRLRLRPCEPRFHPARLVVVGLALFAFCGTIAATRWGIGLSADSMVYIGVARNLLDGNGVTYLNDVGELAPVNHYPPLYPSMIAALALTGMDPLLAAKWMNAFLFAANVVLISAITFISTLSYGASLTAAFFTVSAFPMAQIHSMAWSEPLFVLSGFSGLVLLALYLQGGRRHLLYGAALAVAVSCLARYAGIAFVGAGAAGIFLLAPRRGKKTLMETFAFSALSLLPITAWVFRSAWLTGSATNRSLSFHPPAAADLIVALNSLGLWVFPAGILEAPIWMRIVAISTALLLLLRLARQNTLKALSPRLAGVFLCGYGLFILAARCFFDDAISFETRILAPAYVAAMIVVISALAPPMKSARMPVYVFLSMLLVVQALPGIQWWWHGYTNGIGFTSSVWRNSEALQFVNAAAPSAAIFTNAPDVIYMLSGRRTRMIPAKIEPKSRLANEHYPMEIANMKDELKKTKGLVVYFHGEQRLWYLPSASELQRDAGLGLAALKKDGYVYRVDSSR